MSTDSLRLRYLRSLLCEKLSLVEIADPDFESHQQVC